MNSSQNRPNRRITARHVKRLSQNMHDILASPAVIVLIVTFFVVGLGHGLHHILWYTGWFSVYGILCWYAGMDHQRKQPRAITEEEALGYFGLKPQARAAADAKAANQPPA